MPSKLLSCAFHILYEVVNKSTLLLSLAYRYSDQLILVTMAIIQVGTELFLLRLVNYFSNGLHLRSSVLKTYQNLKDDATQDHTIVII